MNGTSLGHVLQGEVYTFVGLSLTDENKRVIVRVEGARLGQVVEAMH